MIRHLSRRERWIAIVTVGVLVFSAAERFVWRPFSVLVRDRVGSVQSRQIQLAKNLGLVADEEQVAENYDTALAKYGLFLSGQEETARMLQEVERVGQAARVNILDIKPLAVRNKTFFKIFSLELECEGEIDRIAQFLLNIDESSDGMRVDKMRLGTRRATASALRGTLQVSKIRLLSEGSM